MSHPTRLPIQWARGLPRMLERLVVQLRPGRAKTSLATDVHQHQDRAQFEILEKRLEHLEAMVEGLQDAVYRESARQEREIDQLQKGAEPAEMRRALSQDAREHGI
jgi:hypothetical protein